MRPATLSSRRTRVLVSAAGAFAALSMFYAWPFVVDDAFITFRYARHLTLGEGFGMNPGVTADGITGPLWLLPLLAAGGLGLGIPFVAQALGVVFSGAAACVLLWSMSARSGANSRGVSAAFLAVSGSYWVWASAGLETGAATFALATLVGSVARRMPRWAPLIALAVVPALRPELVPAACVLAFHARGVPRWLSFSALTLGIAGVCIWRLVMFGTPVPLSVVAKGGSLMNGAAYALVGAALMSMGGGLYLAWRARKRRAARYVALALGVHLLVVAMAGGDWMPGHRLLVPMLPALALLVGWGTTGMRYAWCALAPTLVLLGTFSAFTLHEARTAGIRRETRGRALAQELTAGPVALVDVGYLGWASGLEVVDLGGITDPMVARMPGNHVDRVVDVAYLESRSPATFVLHSVLEPTIQDGEVQNFFGYPTENHLIRSPWFRRGYSPVTVHEYAASYWYVRFERRLSPVD